MRCSESEPDSDAVAAKARFRAAFPISRSYTSRDSGVSCPPARNPLDAAVLAAAREL